MSDQPDTEHQPVHEHVERRLIEAAQQITAFRAEVGEVCDDGWLVAYAELLLQIAAEATYAAEECVRAAEKAPAVDLVALLELGVPEVSSSTASLRTALEGLAHDRLQAEGDVDLPDGRRAYPTWAKERVQTDGLRILGVLVARAADEAWDRETGELLTPTEILTKGAAKIAKCSGLTNPSARWRKGELAKEGVDLDAFMSSEPGRKKVGYTAPPAVRAPIQRGEESAA